MARITVQRQCWQRWPRVLIAEKRNDDGTREERRYVPEGGTEGEWKARCRDVLKLERKARDDYEQAMVTLQGEFARAEHLKAEVDGLKWAIEERDALIHDLLAVYFEGIECNLGDCRDCSHRDWPDPCEGWLLFDLAEQAGIEV